MPGNANAKSVLKFGWYHKADSFFLFFNQHSFKTLEQHIPIELSAMMAMFNISQSNKVATSCLWLLSTWNVASVTGELNFEFYVILISLNLKSHGRLAATILVAAYSFKSTTIWTLYTFDLLSRALYNVIGALIFPPLLVPLVQLHRAIKEQPRHLHFVMTFLQETAVPFSHASK